jgi:hypothetical protein
MVTYSRRCLEEENEELKELLKNILDLEKEREVLTGGGPGWLNRWNKAIRLAWERFEP